MADERILEATLPANYADGQFLTGAQINKIVAILRAGVNFNKEDIDKLANSNKNLVFETVEAADDYAAENEVLEGDVCVVLNGGETEDEVCFYTYDSAIPEWVYTANASLTSLYAAIDEKFAIHVQMSSISESPTNQSSGDIWLAVE
jgi:hypothetical protein